MSSQDETNHSIRVLIIEDSVAIALRIEEFLKTLGYFSIHISNSGKEGIRKFEELDKSGRTPFVCLDYNLPDMDADEILPKILAIQPDAKVILITGLDRNDEEVRDVIMKGVYFYLQKPVRLSNLQETMNTVEGERRANERRIFEINELIQTTMDSHPISLNKICELSRIKADQALRYLVKLEKDGEVISLDDLKEMSCNHCGSVLVKKENESTTPDSEFSCSRCHVRFRASQAKWVTSKAFRLKVKLKLK